MTAFEEQLMRDLVAAREENGRLTTEVARLTETLERERRAWVVVPLVGEHPEDWSAKPLT